jgi:hypothetical protein
MRKDGRLAVEDYPMDRMTRLPAIPRHVLARSLACVLLPLMTALAASPALGAAQAATATPAVTGVPNPTIRVVQASPDAPPVNVLVDGQPVAHGLAFGTASDYADMAAGDHHLQVLPTDGGQPIIDQTITLNDSTASILVATGDLAHIQLQTYAVDNSAPNPGQARLRLINAIPDGPPLSVAIAGTEQPLVTEVKFPNGS